MESALLQIEQIITTHLPVKGTKMHLGFPFLIKSLRCSVKSSSSSSCLVIGTNIHLMFSALSSNILELLLLYHELWHAVLLWQRAV